MSNVDEAAVRVYLLGPLEITGAQDLSHSAAWRSQQNRTILKVLLLNRRHVVTADQLLEILWPGESPTATRPRLYVRISQVRRLLDPEKPQAILRSVDGGGYRLVPASDWWIDVDVFEAAAERGRCAQEAGALKTAIAAYETARHIYRGDLLEEDRYAEWAFAERERLLERYLTLLTELAEAYAQRGRYRRAISIYQQILGRDPYREVVFVRLMLAYYYAGEQVQALRAFERCRRRLEVDLDVAPLPATQALAEQIRAGTLWADEDFPRYPPPAYQGRLFEIPYSLGNTPFLGREREYAWLVGRWQEARPGLILVEGEAGVGKTRLVEELLGFAAAQGARVLRARPSLQKTALPYAPLIDALRALWYAETATALSPAQRTTLSALFASTKRSSGAATQSGPGVRPRQVEEAVARWLATELPSGAVLFVDDVPRLDSASLALTLRLAHVLTVIVTARTEELPRDHPLRAVLHDLMRARRGDRLQLECLPNDVVAALVRQLAQGDLPALSTELARRTSGNPLFLVSALQALFEEGALYVAADGRWAHGWEEGAVKFSVPTGVGEMIERRLRRLDREQRGVFDAIAVIGQDFDFALLRQVVELEEVPLFNMLDALLDLGLVTEPRAQGRSEFAPAHDLYVEVAQATLPRVRWRRLHGRVGDALCRLYPEEVALSGRLAHHYHEAERTSDAVHHAVLAGELALERYVPQQAGMYFEDAAQWAQADDLRLDPVLRARLHAGWAEALRRSGQPQTAFEHYARALSHADAAQKLHLIYQMAALHAMRGQGPKAFTALAETLEVELQEPWMRGALRCSQGYWAALRGEPLRARECAAEGWRRLRSLAESDAYSPWIIDRALIILARTHALWGEWRHARRYAAQALARNTARDDVYGAADAHVTLAQAYYGLGDNAAARAHAEQALTEIEAAGDLRLQGKALYPLGQILLDEAQWDEARHLIERLCLIAEQTGDLEASARGQLLQAQLLLRTGEPGPALALLEPLLVKARAAGVPSYVVLTLRHLAETHVAAGAPADARAAIDEALALAERCRMGHEVQRLYALNARLDLPTPES